MATLKSFITSSLLRKLDCVENESSFVSIKEEVYKLGILESDFFKGNKPNYSKLAKFLCENCPDQLGDKLYYFHSIARPELREIIAERLKLLGQEVGENEDVYTLASRLILTDTTQKNCQIVVSCRLAQEEHCYINFRPTKLRETPPLGESQIETMRLRLSDYFKQTTSRRFAEIHAHNVGKYTYYCVFHSLASKQILVVNSEDKEEILRCNPQLMDILRLDTKTGELSIYVRYANKKLCQIYNSLFADILGDGVMYVINGKYNLNALKSYDILTLGELSDEIKSVSIVSFTQMDVSMCKTTHTGNVAFPLFEAMENPDTEILSAVFEFVFADSSKTYRVKISSPFKARFQLGCDEELVEKFFKSKGLSRDTSNEKLDFLVPSGTPLPVL